MPEPITPAPQPKESAELAAMLIQESVALDSLCNKIINGECRTLACLQRGGHVRGAEPPDPSVATCLELEKAAAMRRAAALLKQQAAPAGLQVVQDQRDIAINTLAKWCVAVKTKGSAWDDWDTHYKNVLSGPGPLRELLDEAIARLATEGG
jgi:hypothetical protein